jgi:outer membrane protein TolC
MTTLCNRFVRAFLLVVALSGSAQRVTAQTTADPLAPLVAEALRANLGLELERLGERRAAADARAARALFLPALELQSRYSRLDGVPNIGDFVNPAYAALNGILGDNRFPTNLDITLPPRHDSRVTVRQPLFNAGILANYSAARSRADGQTFARRAAARRLAADVQSAYLTQASARRAVDIYAAALTLVQENERVADRLLAAGRATPEALFRARADRSEIEQQLAEARQRHTAAARVLNQILRRPLDTAIDDIPDSSFKPLLAISSDSALARGLAGREELRQIDAGIRTGQAGVRAATASFLPSVSVGFDYGFQGRDVAFRSTQDYWVASLVVSWNLFNGGGDAARRAAAGLEVERARTLRQDLEDRIELDIQTSYDAATVARAAIATADDRLVAARRTFELVRRRYEEGAASPIELVDARTALTSAELNRVVTGYQYALRYVDLERAAALRDITP